MLALVNDIKLLSSSSALPQKRNQVFPQWLLALLVLKLLIQCLGNESFPSSKHTLSFGNDQGGNKKQRQDDDDDNNNNNNPRDNGGNGRGHDNNDGKAPKGKDAAKGKEKPNGPSYCCIFHRLDPVEWLTCGHLKLTTFAYFLQHLKRQHLLRKPYYCKNCRIDWDPKEPDSERLWIDHGRAKACHKATVEKTGKLLPGEYENIKNKSKTAHDDQDRWAETWKMFFRHHGDPGSPFLRNVAEETEASNLRRLNRALEERLAALPPGEQRDQMEAFTRGVFDDAFPAYAVQGSANAGLSTSRTREHAPRPAARPRTAPRPIPVSTPAPIPIPAPRSAAASTIGIRTPDRAPHHRLAPNTFNQRYPQPTRIPAYPRQARNPERDTRLSTHPRLRSALGLSPPTPTFAPNTRTTNTATDSGYTIPGPVNHGRMTYGLPSNSFNPTDTINPRLLTNTNFGPANPRPSANAPSNLNTQYYSMNSFQANNTTSAFDEAAFAADVDRGIQAFNSSSQDSEQPPSDTDEYSEMGQNPWKRI